MPVCFASCAGRGGQRNPILLQLRFVQHSHGSLVWLTLRVSLSAARGANGDYERGFAGAEAGVDWRAVSCARNSSCRMDITCSLW